MSTGDFPPSGIRVDGFNEGWIDFEFGAAKSRKGTTRLESVLKYLVGRGEVDPRLDLADLRAALSRQKARFSKPSVRRSSNCLKVLGCSL